MAYETTSVPLAKSQEAIRRLIFQNHGSGISFISHPPQEGFEAIVAIGELPYRVRIIATCETCSKLKDQEQEERRVWRVLYWHLKAMFEAANSGVIDLRDVILPYLVTADGRTVSEHFMPKMHQLTAGDVARVLEE